jgi:hypothetical protein
MVDEAMATGEYVRERREESVGGMSRRRSGLHVEERGDKRACFHNTRADKRIG